MRLTTFYATCLALAAMASAAAVRSPLDDVVLERDAHTPHLAVQARQASSNATSTASSASSTASSSSSSLGGSFNVTESASQDPPNGCSMSNNLSPAQSASWTDYSASTCCTNSTATTCFFRLNSDVSGQERCTIPNCATLEDGDTAQMAGFKPLSTSSGSGPNNNTFKISSSAATKAHQHGQGKLVGAAAALVAAGATAFMVL